MNKIVFHIGTPKTATTTIQRFLYDNRTVLSDCGWSYPDLYLKVDKVGHFNGIIRNGNIFNAERNAITNRGELWDGICKYLGELVKDKNIIISDEDFYYANYMYLPDFFRDLKKHHNNIQVIIYVRIQDKFLESLWNQRVKFHDEYRTIDEFCNDENVLKIADYYTIIETISSVLGSENIIVKTYNKKRFEGYSRGIVEDFCRSIGADIDLNKCLFNKGFDNKSLVGDYAELKRVFNESCGELGIDSWRIRKYGLGIEEAGAQDNNYHSGSFINKAIKERLFDRYHENNLKLSEKYLNKEPFLIDKNENCNVYEKNEHFEIAAIKSLFNIILEQQKIISRITSRQVFLDKINEAKKNKKIAFWGAGPYCYNLIFEMNIIPEVIYDNDMNKSGQNLYGIPITYPEKVNSDQYFVIITVEKYEQVEKQLKKMGFIDSRDYISLHFYEWRLT